MTILGILLTVCILGVLCWLISVIPQIPAPFKAIGYAVVVIALLIIVAEFFGIHPAGLH